MKDKGEQRNKVSKKTFKTTKAGNKNQKNCYNAHGWLMFWKSFSFEWDISGRRRLFWLVILHSVMVYGQVFLSVSVGLSVRRSLVIFPSAVWITWERLWGSIGTVLWIIPIILGVQTERRPRPFLLENSLFLITFECSYYACLTNSWIVYYFH